MTRRNWVKEFRAAAATFDRAALIELASEYKATSTPPIPCPTASPSSS